LHTESTTKLAGVNIASQWVLHVINVVVNFFLIGYVVAKVGPEHYGGWTTIVSMIGYLSLLSAGLSLAVQHYVARLSAVENHSELISMFSSSYVIYTVSAALALVVCLGLSFFYDSIFTKVPAQSAMECAVALRWVAISMFLMMLNLPVQGALLGLQRYYLRNIAEAMGLFVRTVTVVIAFRYFGYSIAYLGLAFFVASCVRFFFCKIALWRICPELKFRFSTINKEAFRNIFSFGGHSFVWTISVIIIRDSAPILATIIIGPKAATYWYVGNRLCVAFGGLITGAGQVFVPVASSFYISEKWDQLKSALIRGTRFCGLFAFSGSVVLIMFGRDLIYFWMGSGFEASYYVLVIITLGWLTKWTFSVGMAVLIGARRLWLLTSMMLFYVIGGVLLATLLGYKWGILGLTAGFVIPLVINEIFFIPYFSAEACKIKLRVLLTRSLFAPLIIALTLILCIMVTQHIIPASNVVRLIVQISLALVVFGALTFLFGLDTATRRVLIDRFNIKAKSLGCLKK